MGDSGRALLARIVEEGEAAFSTPRNDPQTMQLARREGVAPFGAEQLIGSSIEQLLIGFIRRGADEAAAAAKPTSLIRERTQQEFIDRVSKYLEDNIAKRLTLSDICRDNLVGRSYLQKIFRGKDGRRRNGILRHAEDRRGQAHDPGRHAQFHRDCRAAGL